MAVNRYTLVCLASRGCSPADADTRSHPHALCVCSEKDVGDCDELYDIVGHEEEDEDIYDDLMTVRSRFSVIVVWSIPSLSSRPSCLTEPGVL